INLTTANVLVNGTGTAAATLNPIATTGPNSRAITLSNITGNGTLSISIAPGTASDAAGNLAPGAGPSATLVVDNAPPTLVIGEPSVSITNEGPLEYRITYDGASLISLTKADVLVNGTGTVAAMLDDVT